ncbi:MAG: Ku protein [Deltaproteobacteria bacterium]|nr:MAG: Ku protein [Deltaproteobacteria bacterium]
MARPIWSGSISFGLVSVPVKLFSATSPKEVRFHMLHDKDGARIQQKRVCSADGQEVPWEHIVKGFEISKGRYVTVAREELEAFNPRATKAIEIEDFVDLEQIDPIYYESTYYLVPDRGASKPYALLVEAMKKTGKVGVAKFVLRTKQYLCAVRPLGKALAVSTMLYADEVVSQDELEGLPESKPGERELKMAEQLIGSLESDFDIKKYKDDYREQVLALLERKAEGEEIVAAEPAEAPRGKVVNLMDALQKSLAAAKKGELREAEPDRGEVRRKPHPHHRAAARTARKRKSR